MKGWHGLLFQVGLLVCLGAHEAFPEIPYIDLFRGRNCTDYRVRLNSSIPWLHTVDLDDQIHSYRGHSNVILYDYYEYNRGASSSKYVTKFHTDDNVAVGETDASLSTISSVRFIGSYVNGAHVPSITLFKAPNFSELEEELITASKSVINTTSTGTDSSYIISAIIVGVSDWTFYDKVNFDGPGLCVKGSSNYTGVQLFPLTYPPQGINLVEKKSVERGCWARHGVPLELKQ